MSAGSKGFFIKRTERKAPGTVKKAANRTSGRAELLTPTLTQISIPNPNIGFFFGETVDLVSVSRNKKQQTSKPPAKKPTVVFHKRTTLTAVVRATWTQCKVSPYSPLPKLEKRHSVRSCTAPLVRPSVQFCFPKERVWDETRLFYRPHVLTFIFLPVFTPCARRLWSLYEGHVSQGYVKHSTWPVRLKRHVDG